MSAAVETAAPTSSCLTNHYPGFAPRAASTQGKAPPPQNNPEGQVPWLNPYNLTTSSMKSNTLGAKDSQSGCFPSHFLPKMHQTGLKAIPGPGIKKKKKKSENLIKITQPGGSTKAFLPEGEGNERSRRFSPSIITQNLHNSLLLPSGAK